jgi:hypothetical protein
MRGFIYTDHLETVIYGGNAIYSLVETGDEINFSLKQAAAQKTWDKQCNCLVFL